MFISVDPGIFVAHCEGRREPEILDFASLDEAKQAAKTKSIDPEGEMFACAYRGRDEYLAIYNNGEEP